MGSAPRSLPVVEHPIVRLARGHRALDAPGCRKPAGRSAAEPLGACLADRVALPAPSRETLVAEALHVNFDALSCPQCGGPLPRQALWRMVACPQCRAMVTRSSRVVERKTFHDA